MKQHDLTLSSYISNNFLTALPEQLFSQLPNLEQLYVPKIRDVLSNRDLAQCLVFVENSLLT